jgi:hypothetical protein
MPQDITVKALKGFHYRGRAIWAGGHLAMSPVDAAIEGRRGNVSLTKVIDAEPDEPEPQPEAVPEPVAQAPEPAPEPEQKTPTRRRRYARRDLVAEQP